MKRVNRRVVLVTGAPASGKSTIAEPLARALGFALLSKDRIKETLHDALHDALRAPEGDLAASRRLGECAMRLMYTLAAGCPAVVMDANFKPNHPDTRPRLLALCGRPVEVYCVCPPAEAARRFAARAVTAHPTHVWRELPPEILAEHDRPLALGPVITVDTTGTVDLTSVVARTRAALTRP